MYCGGGIFGGTQTPMGMGYSRAESVAQWITTSNVTITTYTAAAISRTLLMATAP